MATTTVNMDITRDTSLVNSSGGGKTAPIDTPDDTIASEVVGETSKGSTTQFVDDSVMVVRDESHVTHVDTTLTKLADSQTSVDDLIGFLSKPITLTSSSFTTADTFSIFNSLSMPYAALMSTPGLIWRQKLAGFFGIRMDIRFRMVVNANKFQQGRYIMGWTPVGGSKATTSNLKNINFNFAHNATLVQRTTVPHVELDLANDTTAELLIPFASVHSFYPLNNVLASRDEATLGYLNVYPYDVLKAPTGSTVCGYTIYVSFENVSLYGAASAQGGTSKKEVANKNNGPVSGVASALSKGFKEFGNIPLIGEYAKGVSWITDRIANTASIFGFSKPTAGDCIPKMMLLNAPSHSTIDGDSDSRTLSFLNTPGVVPIKGLAGTDFDEMDFSYIKSKYAWFETKGWPTSALPGDVIHNINVSPLTGSRNISTAFANTFSFAPVAFLANQFYWWRGSLKFRFKIVKTEYHSGRLQFAYYPTDENSYTGGEAYVNRVIVDVREHSEVELIVPYMSRFPWLTPSDISGILRVSVIDQLVAPSSVSNFVNILMEISGGPDFEVAAPRTFDYTPVYFTPQGFAADKTESTIISTTIGNSEVRGDELAMSSLTIGDKVSSGRAILKRFTPLHRMDVNTGTLNSELISVVPDAVLFHNNSAYLAANLFHADMLSIWASCYTFMSGGIRIRDNIDFGLAGATVTPAMEHTSFKAIMTMETTTEGAIIASNAPASLPRNYHHVLQDTSCNNTVTVEVPQYTQAFSRSLVDVIIFQTAAPTAATRYTANSSASPVRVKIAAPVGVVSTLLNNYSYHNVYRAAADDFNLSGFISIPPLAVYPTQTFFSNY